MVGKLVLLAAVCVALVQGDAALENAIKRGLQRAEGINKNGQRRIDAAINEVGYKRKLIEAKAADFIERSNRLQSSLEDIIAGVAEQNREKARETKRPQSVFECIDRVEENAVKSAESYTKKFNSDIERTERIKLENIATYAKPLDSMQDSLKVRFDRAVEIINGCQNNSCINIAINSFLNWLDLLFAEISRIRSQIVTAVANFQRDGNTYFTNTNKQVTRIRTASTRNIALCLRNREAIFGEEY